MRGRAIVTRRSRNSHIRSPRSVVCAPIGIPSRSLNWAMDLRALVTIGFWPVMASRSRMAPSISLAVTGSLAHPHVDDDLDHVGTCITLA